jgi:hypothetical protein
VVDAEPVVGGDGTVQETPSLAPEVALPEFVKDVVVFPEGQDGGFADGGAEHSFSFRKRMQVKALREIRTAGPQRTMLLPGRRLPAWWATIAVAE